MANEDYGDYSQFIIQKIRPDAPLPPMPPGSVTNMCYLDDAVIPGSWNVITAWLNYPPMRLESMLVKK